MDRSENQRWARYCEWTARIAFRLTEDRESFRDAVTGEGQPVEIKAARVRKGRHERAGTFWIEQDAHEELKARGGLYAFVLYDPTNHEDGPIRDVILKPAVFVDSVNYVWTTTGGHHKGEFVKKPPWTAVFDSISKQEAAADGGVPRS